MPMGLDIFAGTPDPENPGEYITRTFGCPLNGRVHFTWSRFLNMLAIITHNAVRTNVVANEDDPEVQFMSPDANREPLPWTPEKCRDVSVLIRRILDASKYDVDENQATQAAKRRKERMVIRDAIARIMDGTGPEAVAVRILVADSDVDEMESDARSSDDDEGDDPDRRYFQIPATAYDYWCDDYDDRIMEFARTMAIFSVNGWTALFH